ncbi:heavy metal translocating P-type ATPase [Desulfobotulus mexicanus]|uniref:P-type Zn(2+) transporter n=1 Tax=Desulfobotulus mexicanus TaxID=2586642 RepID=A0A5Q4VE27_9BACT|nr:cation-translocating P-type ATPase [Desulfobotulus mexicanus]TYT75176.1 cation-translocating P-type ATPase [Desulfobotulus mexicanus]
MKKKFAVRHDIPGRLRIRALSLRQTETEKKLKERSENLEGLLWLRINPGCASLVLFYDKNKLSREDLLEFLNHFFGMDGVTPLKNPADDNPECVCVEEHAVRKAFSRFAAISVVMGGVLLRNAIFKTATLQTAFSPLGIVTFALTAPLIRSALKRSRERKFTLDGFLAAGSTAAIAAGEAMTALEILWINSGAELLSAWIAERSRKSIASILDITSHHTFVLIDGVEVERHVSELEVGDIVVLHTGEKISVDGVIVHGQALVNEAPITGRDEQVHRKEGDTVHAGTFVRQGVIQVRAEFVGDSTYLARVMHKVECALESRAPIEGVADRLAGNLVKVGLGVTAVTFITTGSAWRAFTVLLVMACPCATVLAASTAISAAISAAAKSRILVKGGRYMEEVGKCDLVFFDKTGTLTTTEPVLQEVITLPGIEEDELLTLACSTETHNHHPLAQAVVAEARRRGLSSLPHEVCEYYLGMGMRAVINGREMLVGNAKLLNMFDAHNSQLTAEFDRMSSKGLTVLHVFQDKKPLGLMGFASQVRPEARQVLNRLRAMGVRRIVLITGDEENSARQLAESLGIEEYHASLMPEEKALIVEKAMAESWKTMVVGDGINDALALTAADVGVAIGTAGSEVAVEAADIALASDDLDALADVYGLSQQTLGIVRQNFWIATGSNLVGVSLGALGLLSPVAAGLVHMGHSLGVLANSSRLLAFHKNDAQKSCNASENY